MANNDRGTIQGSSDGGLAGKHDVLDSPQFLVGSSTDDQFNTVILPLLPVACFRVDDVRFAFDSSFVASDPVDDKKDIREELRLLVTLIKDNPGSPLSVFGHADPVGNDVYNKGLSGRRATVIYALLISNSEPDTAVKLWKEVAQQEHWDAKQRGQMQALTGLPAGTADNALFKAYMQKLAPPELTLAKTDFLAQGADPKGKGDYQGCSEFNPVLIFSTKRHQEFESQSDKTARNDANATNRRVMVLLFQKGSKVEFAKWPCPRASEGVSGCIKRFWSDGTKRRSTRLPDKDRKFEDTKDTFACRFYQRLLTDSPCESPLTFVKIRLFDPKARPLPFAPCLITESGRPPRPERASGAPPGGSTPSSVDKQDAIVTFRAVQVPTTVNVKWSRAKAGDRVNSPAPQVFTDTQNEVNRYKYEFEMDVAIDIPETDPNVASLLRLKNLGYVQFASDAENIRAFQRDYKPRFGGIVEDGTLNQPTIDALKETHDSSDPVLKAGNQIPVKR